MYVTATAQRNLFHPQISLFYGIPIAIRSPISILTSFVIAVHFLFRGDHEFDMRREPRAFYKQSDPCFASSETQFRLITDWQIQNYGLLCYDTKAKQIFAVLNLFLKKIIKVSAFYTLKCF